LNKTKIKKTNATKKNNNNIIFVILGFKRCGAIFFSENWVIGRIMTPLPKIKVAAITGAKKDKEANIHKLSVSGQK
jgi:hypothetical protein